MKGMLMAENSSRGAPKPGVRRTTKIRPRALKTEPCVALALVSRRARPPARARSPQQARHQKMPRQSVSNSRLPPATGASMGARMVTV